MKRRWLRDAAAVAALILLWLFFFWRLFTPISADQASLKQGDFSAQFVTFAAYQYERLSNGEIPLWNPYNNGGFPFIADTQSAVFYPPRLATIALAKLSGGWSYHALELEMTAHVLAYTLMMYAFVRRLTSNRKGSVAGGLTAAVIAGYGGFLSGYPPLQLALLEACIWLPMGALGLLEAARGDQPRYRWLAVTGVALGLSWLAGHPQSSYFLTLFYLCYFAYLVYAHRWRWTVFIGGTAIFGALAFGVAAIQLIPGLEYLPLTARADFTFDAKANGFPVQDLLQMLFPGILSLFSPLYVGFVALVLAIIAVWRKMPQAAFFAIVGFAALLWSLGENGALYPALYNLLPGLRFFRGQERAAFLVANCLAILGGSGLAALFSWHPAKGDPGLQRLQRGLRWCFLFTLAVLALIFVVWIGDQNGYKDALGHIAFAAIIIGILWLALPIMITAKDRRLLWLIPIVVAFELFTVSWNAASTYDAISPEQQISITPPKVIESVLADDGTFRVDGFRGFGGNFGSMYGIQDIHGISPLFLSDARAIIEAGFPNPRAWELFAVKYVFSDWNELPVASEVIDQGVDRFGAINVHELESPRPFAQIMFNVHEAESHEAAMQMLNDPSINLRSTLILAGSGDYIFDAGEPIAAQIISFAPERIEIAANTTNDGLLSVALVYYPGWHAEIDGQQVPILRANGALSAIELPAGDHHVTFTYQPLSFTIGAIISLLTGLGLLIFFAIWSISGLRYAKR
ncbi:MAG: YfhO family protein [Anaerolineae bacterium]|nr:YfhO family protein [Anaerolineae bacterium]